MSARVAAVAQQAQAAAGASGSRNSIVGFVNESNSTNISSAAAANSPSVPISYECNDAFEPIQQLTDKSTLLFKEITGFLKKRIALEEEYSKNLSKLVKTSPTAALMTSLDEPQFKTILTAWQDVLTKSEEHRQSQVQSIAQMQESLNSLFINDIETQRKLLKTSWEKKSKEFKLADTQQRKVHEKYVQLSSELDEFCKKDKSKSSEKELAIRKKVKIQQNEEIQLCEMFNLARQRYFLEDVPSLVEKYQGINEQLLMGLVLVVTQYRDLLVNVKSGMEKHNEDVSFFMDSFDFRAITEGIVADIKQKHLILPSERPFQDLSAVGVSSLGSIQAQLARTKTALVSRRARTQSIVIEQHQAQAQAQNNNTLNSNNNEIVTNSSAQLQPQSQQQQQPNNESQIKEESKLNEVSPLKQQQQQINNNNSNALPQNSTSSFIAAYNYDAKESREISCKAGDSLAILSNIPSRILGEVDHHDMMIFVNHISSGKQGFVPKDILLSEEAKSQMVSLEAVNSSNTNANNSNSSASIIQKRTFEVPKEIIEAMPKILIDLSIIPKIYTKSINFILAEGISVEGLFRVSGSLRRSREMKVAYDTTGELEFDSMTHIHDVTTLLKLQIREQPDDIYPESSLNHLLKIYKTQDIVGRFECVKNFLESLNLSQASTFGYLMEMLKRISAESSLNKMSNDNIVKVFGPTLFNALSIDVANFLTDFFIQSNGIFFYQETKQQQQGATEATNINQYVNSNVKVNESEDEKSFSNNDRERKQSLEQVLASNENE